MSYQIISTSLALRPPEMLVRDVPEGGGKPPYDEVAPGLYPDEIVVQLEDGELVAVSVERYVVANKGDLALHGYARWINSDGSTKLSGTGDEIEASASASIDSLTFQEHGADKLAREFALVMLGEEPELNRDVPVEDGDPIVMPVLMLSDEVRENASIRNQIRAAKAAVVRKVDL